MFNSEPGQLILLCLKRENNGCVGLLHSVIGCDRCIKLAFPTAFGVCCSELKFHLTFSLQVAWEHSVHISCFSGRILQVCCSHTVGKRQILWDFCNVRGWKGRALRKKSCVCFCRRVSSLMCQRVAQPLGAPGVFNEAGTWKVH